MDLTPQQIVLIQSTFPQIAVNADALGDILYPKLFARLPEAEALFGHGKQTNSQKLFWFILFIVDKLESLHDLHEEFRNLANRHKTYKVNLEYFEPFGAVFIEALQELLGEEATEEVITAWRKLYAIVSRVMIDDMQ